MKGKVAIVTGAASGFGAETAVLFASLGCHLSLVDRNCMQGTLDRCLKAGLSKEQVILTTADLNVTDSLKIIPKKTVEHFGKVDILVNSAGIAVTEPIAETPESKYDLVMNINAKAIFFLIQQCIPHLIKTKGNVVNVSSISGMRPRARCTGYAISKAAVNQITQCAALEFGPQHVRVNAVNPGHCRTGLYNSYGMSEEQIEAYVISMLPLYPLGKIGSALDVAKAILFLADENQSTFVTGVCLPVDGGFFLGNSRS